MKTLILGLTLLFALSFSAIAEEKHDAHKDHKAGDQKPAATATHTEHKDHKAGDCKKTDKDAKKNCG